MTEQEILEQMEDQIDKHGYNSANLRLALIKENQLWKVATGRVIFDISKPKESEILLDENNCRLVDYFLSIDKSYELLDYLKTVHVGDITSQNMANIPDEMFFKIGKVQICLIGNFLDNKLNFYGRDVARTYHGVNRAIYFADYAISPTVAAQTHHKIDLSGHKIPLRNFTEALNHYWQTKYQTYTVSKSLHFYLPIYDGSISSCKVKGNEMNVIYEIDTKRVHTNDLSIGIIAEDGEHEYRKRHKIENGNGIQIDLGFYPSSATITLHKNSEKIDEHNYTSSLADKISDLLGEHRQSTPTTHESVIETKGQKTILERTDMDKIGEKLDDLFDLVQRNQITIEALLSHVLEKENITQDKYDELMELLKEFGRKKGLYHDKT